MTSITTETPQPEITPISESENIITRKIEDIILDPKINTREVDSEILGEYKDVINGYHREVVQGNAAMEAAKEAYTRISVERTEEEA